MPFDPPSGFTKVVGRPAREGPCSDQRWGKLTDAMEKKLDALLKTLRDAGRRQRGCRFRSAEAGFSHESSVPALVRCTIRRFIPAAEECQNGGCDA